MKTEHIRNVVLLGHSGSGKTTFVETMLFESGAIPRRGNLEDGSTISDYTNIEKEKGNSLFSSLMHVHWKDSKINIVDTPGLDDFVGEVVSSMKVADTGVVMLNAKGGVEVGTELIWEYIEKFKTPALFVVNHLDNEKADYQSTLDQARARFGSRVVPVQYPLSTGSSFNTIVDALRMVMYQFDDSGGKPEKLPIPESEIGKAQAMHNALVEVAAENEEGLMERFFDEGTLNEEELAKGLTIALANQEFYPVFCCSAEQNKGSGRIMGFINDICPSPADRQSARLEGGEDLPTDASGDTTVFIYKTLSEPQVGMVSYFKVYSGTLHSGDELVNVENGITERFNQIFVAEGKQRTHANLLVAGDLGVTVKLKNSHTNQTLNQKGVTRSIEQIDFPKPRIRGAIGEVAKGDIEKLIKSLHQIEEEDPTLVIEQSASLNQTILHGQGQLHLDLIKYRIEKVNNLKYDYVRPRIPYRETITKTVNAHYRHKKQSGGAGQFAEVHLRVEPYVEGMAEPSGLSVRKTEVDDFAWGGSLVLKWCIVGGSIDAKYLNAIKKGILQQMEDGPLTGSYCQNIRVSIYDGKMHAVDSNDMAFMIAAGQAFKEAFEQASPQLLEPIFELEVLCAGTAMGDVMSDLQTRRAMIMGMDSDGHYQKIVAKVPLVELYKYSSTLRSITQGRAKFSRKFLEYASMTPDIQQRVIAMAKE